VTAGLDAAFTLAETLNASRQENIIMVAGGGDIYTQAMARADRLHITEVDMQPEGDTWFPDIDRTIWRETSRKAHPKGPDDDAAYAFVDYVRR
jgi:dihydrofolate reductase